jgi:hypothetical protein
LIWEEKTNKNISEQGSSAMPNVSEKEEQSKGSVTKSEPNLFISLG